MRLAHLLPGALLIATSVSGFAFTHSRRGPTAQRSWKHASRATHPSGQRAIDDTRATEIQGALTNAGYLSGQPTGHWDGATASAMQRFQADNGWQTKLIPDSRAIIKLGLGPRALTSQATSPTGLGAQ